MGNILAASLVGLLAITPAFAHDTGAPHEGASPVVQPWPFKVESKGPVKATEVLKEKVPVSGQGFWKFVAVTNAVPVPAEITDVKQAHGTVVVDAERDTLYWGLKRYGWVAFSNQLRDSWVVKGDEAFTHNNLHGADILPRKGQRPLIAAADNEGDKVYLTDPTFQNPQILKRIPRALLMYGREIDRAVYAVWRGWKFSARRVW